MWQRSRTNRARTHESELLKRLIITLVILFGCILAFALWGIQLLVSVSEVTSGLMRKEPPVKARVEPIFPPRLEPLSSATNSAHITVSGVGREGFELELYHNDELVKKTVIDTSGTFQFEGLTLKEGSNTLAAKQIKDKNTSPLSEPIHIIFDKQPPKIELTEPAPDTQRQGSDQKELKISGRTEEGVTITVNDRWVTVNGAGAFATTVQLQEGNNQILITATDASGNATKIIRLVTFVP